MIIFHVLQKACLYLEMHHIDNPYLDASLIYAHHRNMSRTELLLHIHDIVHPYAYNSFWHDIYQRAHGIPVAYITGHRFFYELDFFVNIHTLIPRPETEILVEYAINYARSHNCTHILDMCTGTGCIAISIQHALPHIVMNAADIDLQTLTLFRKNSMQLLNYEIPHYHSDLFTNLSPQHYDIITANPPYVSHDEAVIIAQHHHEPILALDGGDNGCILIKRLIADAYTFLCHGGRLIIEAGYNQESIIKTLFLHYGYQQYAMIRDLAGHPRVFTAVKA